LKLSVTNNYVDTLITSSMCALLNLKMHKSIYFIMLIFVSSFAQAQIEIIDTNVIQTVEGITDPTIPDPGIGDAVPITTGGDEDPARKVAVKAAFPGGEAAFREFVATEFQYPVRCQDKGINGSVVLRFVVDQKGRVSRISAIEETAGCPEFTDEAIRVLKRSPRWIPAQNKGKFVISWREIPIKLTVE